MEVAQTPSSIFPPAAGEGSGNLLGPLPAATLSPPAHTLSVPPLSSFLCVQWFECWLRAWPNPTSVPRTVPSQLQLRGLGIKTLGG